MMMMTEKECERAKAERDRLREALCYCLDDLKWARENYATGNEFDEGIRQARAALEEASDE